MDWHWTAGPNLEQCGYMHIYRQRPEGVTELGYVTSVTLEGNPKTTLQQVRMKSQNSDHGSDVRFRNLIDSTVRIIWLNFQGHEVEHSILITPGRLFLGGIHDDPSRMQCLVYPKFSLFNGLSVCERMTTYLTHPWICRKVENGERVLINGSEVFLPSPEPQEVDITSPPQLPWTLSRHKFFSIGFKQSVRCLLLCHNRLRHGETCLEDSASDDTKMTLKDMMRAVAISFPARLMGMQRTSPNKSDTPAPPCRSLGDLSIANILKIVSYMAEDHPTRQTLLKGLEAAPDLSPIDVSCLVS